MVDFVPPQHGQSAFTCPHCGAYSQQEWPYEVLTRPSKEAEPARWTTVDRSKCLACNREVIWRDFLKPVLIQNKFPHDWQYVWPHYAVGESAHPQLPEDLTGLYEEARAIATDSPRSAAALLRLVVEQLVRSKTGPETKLNDGIGELVRSGELDARTQQVADYVRVSGNDAVHPIGEIQHEDTQEQTETLFSFVNLLVQKLIEQPQQIAALYQTLPESKRSQIEKRDRGAEDAGRQ